MWAFSLSLLARNGGQQSAHIILKKTLTKILARVHSSRRDRAMLGVYIYTYVCIYLTYRYVYIYIYMGARSSPEAHPVSGANGCSAAAASVYDI